MKTPIRIQKNPPEKRRPETVTIKVRRPGEPPYNIVITMEARALALALTGDVDQHCEFSVEAAG